MGNFKIVNHTQGTESQEVCSESGCLWNKSFTVKPGDQLSLYYYKSGGTLPIGTKVHFKDNISKAELKVDSIGDGGYVNPWWSTSWAGGKYDIYAYDEYENAGTKIITLTVESSSVPITKKPSTLTINSRNYSPFKIGETVAFYGILEETGTIYNPDINGASVRVIIRVGGTIAIDTTTTTYSSTSPGENYQYKWTVPSTISGASIYGKDVVVTVSFAGNDSYNSAIATSSTYYIEGKPAAVCNITLDQPASSVYTGDTVTFRGKFVCDGIGVSGKTVKVYDSMSLPDTELGSTTTLLDGSFSVSWTVKYTSYLYKYVSVYAIEIGTGKVSSPERVTTITEKSIVVCTVSLNKPSSTVEIGQSITFSGQLSCGGIGLSGKTIEIWDTLGINEKIATATTTTTNGMFSAPWTVKDINYYPNSGKISVYAYYPETGLKSQEYAVTLSSIPPIDIKYSCNLGVCQQTVNGQYTTLTECQNACKGTTPTPDKYVCINGTCQKDNVSGTLTLEQCQSTCKITPPPSTTKYNCINSTCTADTSGIYSVDECQNVCSPPSGCPSGYYKTSEGRCKKYIRTPMGNMKEEDALLFGMGTIGAITGFILLKEVLKK